MLKLVKFDKDAYLTEIDQKAMRREAQELIDYINSAPKEEQEKYSYDGRLLSIIKDALNNKLEIPFKGTIYNTRFMLEGMQPMLLDSFKKYYYPFLFRIQGDPSTCSHSIKKFGKYIPGACEEIRDGERYEWCDFED